MDCIHFDMRNAGKQDKEQVKEQARAFMRDRMVPGMIFSLSADGGEPVRLVVMSPKWVVPWASLWGSRSPESLTPEERSAVMRLADDAREAERRYASLSPEARERFDAVSRVAQPGCSPWHIPKLMMRIMDGKPIGTASGE